MQVASRSAVYVVISCFFFVISDIFDPFTRHAGVIDVVPACPAIIVMFVSACLSNAVCIIVAEFSASPFAAIVVLHGVHHCHHLL